MHRKSICKSKEVKKKKHSTLEASPKLGAEVPRRTDVLPTLPEPAVYKADKYKAILIPLGQHNSDMGRTQGRHIRPWTMPSTTQQPWRACGEDHSLLGEQESRTTRSCEAHLAH